MDATAYSALPRVVLDNGSGFVKIGLASSKKPPHVIPNCVGHPKKKFSSHYFETHFSSSVNEQNTSSSHSTNDSNTFVSESCYTLLEYFCYRPQVNSLVYDANRQRMVWEKYIGRSNLTNTNGVISPGNLLSVNPESTSICVTEPNLCPAQSRQLLAEILFEDFGFPLACFLSSQTASSYFYETLSSRKIRQDFGFHSYPKNYISKKDPNLSCCLVVDCGFGSTHAVPFVNGEPILNASLRTNAAGSLCNTYLKNVTALRSVNLEFNELIVQHMKEESCYVSSNFDLELKAAKKLLKLYGTHLLSHQYVLPIYTSRAKTQMIKHFSQHRTSTPPLLNEYNEKFVRSLATGEIKTPEELEEALANQQTYEDDEESDNESTRTPKRENSTETYELNDEGSQEQSPKDLDAQCVDLYAERFSIPEVLFSPQDIKLKDCGIVDLVYRSLALCPSVVQPLLARNIFVCGGSTKFPGFVKRLYNDLRPKIPQAWDIGIYTTEDPSLSSFYGAKLWTNNDSLFLSTALTRNVYFENGGSVIKIDELIESKQRNL